MSQELIFDSQTSSARTWASWLYLAHGVSFLFTLGALSFIPLILNYIKRGDAAGTFAQSHHTWQIRSFWWYVVWMAIGWVLFVTLIGIPFAYGIWALAWLWKAYRLIRGWITLHNNQPI